MPSHFFDPEIFGDLILSAHAHRETPQFETRTGHHLYPLVDAKFTEFFKLVFQDAQGIPMEGTQARITCRYADLPYKDPMGHYVQVDGKRWEIVGSEPDGYGLVILILDNDRPL